MRGERTNTLVITTPEGIEFSYLLACPLTRFFAWIIDFCCIASVISIITIVMQLFAIISPGMAQAALLLLYFAITIGYGILTEWFWRGQTVGKRLFKLRVIDEQGLRLQFAQVVIRNLLRFVDALPVLYLVGGIACLLSKQSQRLGDFAANTIVIRTPKLVEPDLTLIANDKYNSLRDYPHLEARLRQQVKPDEAALALKAVMRRNELDPEARIDLFGELATHFQAHVAFPEEACLGLTDEQYVRNVVETLFRTQTTIAAQKP